LPLMAVAVKAPVPLASVPLAFKTWLLTVTVPVVPNPEAENVPVWLAAAPITPATFTGMVT